MGIDQNLGVFHSFGAIKYSGTLNPVFSKGLPISHREAGLACLRGLRALIKGLSSPNDSKFCVRS